MASIRLRRALVPTFLLVTGVAASFPTPAYGALPVVDLDCGDSVSESLKLADDLLDCPSDGLDIDAPHITLDLGGHVVDGTAGPGDTGISNPAGYSDVTIRNGTVRQFELGIEVGSGGTDGVLDNLEVAANTGVGIKTSHGLNTVSNNIVAGNGDIGIEMFGGNVIKNNLVAGNGSDGIKLGEEDVVRGNTSVRNGGAGIRLLGDRIQVVGNTSAANLTDGIEVNGDENVLETNVLVGNGPAATFENGIEVDGDDNELTKNTATGNSGDGIDIASGTGNAINKNVTDGNGYGLGPDGAGLGIETDASSTGSENTARGNDNPDECDQGMCKPNAGPGGTTALDCGDPVTTSIVLGEDLLDCDDSGLVVDADNITLDLNGHRISHDGAPDPTDLGIDIGTHKKVTVIDGELVGFYHNVVSAASTKNAIQNLMLAGSAQDGIQLNGSQHVVRSNTVVRSGNFGVQIDAPDRTVVSGNISTANAAEGIRLSAGQLNAIKRNRSFANGGSGVQLADADRDAARKNALLGNGNFGISLTTGQRASVRSNTVSGNVNIGVFLADGGDVTPNKITKNRANANGYNFGASNGAGLGIDASGADDTTGKNTARGNDDPDECDPASLC